VPAPVALVRRPGPRLTEGIVTHIARTPDDIDLALAQWNAYVESLTAHGWQPLELPAAHACADAVFVEDAVVVRDDLAVVTRPGATARRAETDGLDVELRALGLRTVAIAGTATLDGGDVLQVGDTVYVGLGGRTNREGIDQLAGLLAPLRATVVAVPITRVLHLKSAVTALPDGTVIGYLPLVDDPAVFPAFLAVPEPEGVAVVVLDRDSVLMSASAPRTADLLRERGLEVVTTPLTEFEKLEGCVTCLSVRLRN